MSDEYLLLISYFEFEEIKLGVVFLLVLPGMGVPGRAERKQPGRCPVAVWVRWRVQPPLRALLDEGTKVWGYTLLLCGMSSLRVAGRARPAICWLVGRNFPARPCLCTVSARTWQCSAAPSLHTMLMAPELYSWSGRAGARVVKCQQGFFHLYVVRFYAAVFLMMFLSEARCGQ